MEPGNIKNHYFEQYLQSVVLNVTVYVQNIISFFYKQKTGEILIFRTFLAKNSILAYVSLKIGKLGKIVNCDVIVTSCTEYLFFFWYVWKEETHYIYMVPNKHTSGVYCSSS